MTFYLTTHGMTFLLKPLSNAPTDSSLDTVCGISTSSSTISPTASHQYLSGILDRLVFRPKSLAAQKFDRGEYEKSTEGSKTATSARLGLLPLKTAQQSSAFSTSKYDRSNRVAADAIGYEPFVAASICTDAIPDVAVRATALSGKVSAV